MYSDLYSNIFKLYYYPWEKCYKESIFKIFIIIIKYTFNRRFYRKYY